jgi:hypothetical protein
LLWLLLRGKSVTSYDDYNPDLVIDEFTKTFLGELIVIKSQPHKLEKNYTKFFVTFNKHRVSIRFQASYKCRGL